MEAAELMTRIRVMEGKRGEKEAELKGWKEKLAVVSGYSDDCIGEDCGCPSDVVISEDMTAGDMVLMKMRCKQERAKRISELAPAIAQVEAEVNGIYPWPEYEYDASADSIRPKPGTERPVNLAARLAQIGDDPTCQKQLDEFKAWMNARGK